MSEQACGCCTGVEAAVPASEVNPPGQSALTYRVGTYATFFETMLARLTGLTLEVPSASGVGTDTLTPLARLTTRDPSDPSIALLDAWATVADVLTFYQERIANEGYLPTAIERRSILELARLIGYRLRPGVAASVKLAFTVANGFSGTLPAGTRAQSIPAAGQNPQFFETSADLDARDGWNALAPRLTRPQVITPARLDSKRIPLVTGADALVTGANVIDTVYLAGTSTNISPGDALLFVFGPNASASPPEQYLRLAAAIDAQADQKRTEVTLNPIMPARPGTFAALLNLDQGLLQLHVNKANDLFAGSDLAQDVVAILGPLIDNIGTGAEFGTNSAALVPAAIAQVALKRSIAVQRGFTRTAAWLATLVQTLQWMSLGPPTYDRSPNQTLKALPSAALPSPLANLGAIIDALATPRSVQPTNALRLQRSVASSYTPRSDIAPRLLAALRPAAAPALYQAWSAIATPAPRVEVHAARVKAGLFAANWAGPATVSESDLKQITTSFANPTIANAWGSSFGGILDGPPDELPLDATYDKIKPGSWVAIDRTTLDANKNPNGRATSFHVVTGLRTASMSAGAPSTGTGAGFAAKVTLLTLDPVWLSDLVPPGSDYTNAINSADVLRGTIVYAQSEPLDLTEEPLDLDVEGAVVDLANAYDGIEPGRWVIVSGTRTDIAGVSGVTASEPAMIAGVAQGAQEAACQSSLPSAPPFSQVHYTTDANANGDRLVVGQLDPTFDLATLKSASPDYLNQQYCEQVELAPGVYANAYVPTAEEIDGRFPTFAGLLVEPTSQALFPFGVIPPASRKAGLFAWRISTSPVHTILTLASPLAYKYDRSTITIYGNVVDATHGQSTGEILGNGNAAQAFASFTLGQSPLTYVSAPTPSGTASTLTVRVNELEWHEVDDLAGATPARRWYVTREDNAQKTSVTFGNGAHGARLPTGTANVKATYRYGIGSAGNVAAGQISQLATHPVGAQGVINPLPATGGADADRIDQARANAPLTTAALDRLVSVRDYADFARTYAGIGKAVAVRLSDGRRQLVHVTIAGSDEIPIDVNSDLFANLLLSLQTYGDPHLPVELAVRRVRLVVMAASVGVLPDYAWEDVAPKVRAAILARFAFNARALGQTAFLSEAIAAAQQVAGVAYVNVTTFDGVPESVTAGQLAALGSSLRRHQYVAAELARVDFQAEAGSPGRILPAELVFMTPDIPDTLILTQAV